MTLPEGPGAPAADAKDAVKDATRACRAVTTITAEIAVSGSVGGRRLRGRLSAGLAPPASARLEAVAPFGAPFFIFVARGNDATLLLPRDNRVLEHGRPETVLEALAGVPLDASALRFELTGCASLATDTEHAKRLGDDWRVVPDGSTDVYLHRDASTTRWRVVATRHHGLAGAARPDAGDWRAEYRDFQPNGLPQSIRLTSSDRERFDLRLTLSQVDINAPLGADVFRVQVPRDADPITIQELKRSGPLATKSDGK